MSSALSGLKVLDLTMNLPGPYMTWLLAALGAEIIKIENRRAATMPESLAEQMRVLKIHFLRRSIATRKASH